MDGVSFVCVENLVDWRTLSSGDNEPCICGGEWGRGVDMLVCRNTDAVERRDEGCCYCGTGAQMRGMCWLHEQVCRLH